MKKWIIIWYWLVPPANLEYYVQKLIDIPSVIYRVEHNYLPVTLNQYSTLVVPNFKIIFYGI